MTPNRHASAIQMAPRTAAIWRALQFAVWLIGAAIFICLIFWPALGILLFWNILIPAAPALLVLATGVWRNVCPLATCTLLPRHLGLSKRKKMSISQQGKFCLLAVLALYLIVPLRHSVFNVSGHATAILLFATAAVGTGMGILYEWKSGWCSSLCPIHPVEKLYGSNTLFELPNAHCDQCMNCLVPCPDSTPNIRPDSSHKTTYHRISGFLTIGGLPGFIWGWFHEPDVLRPPGGSNLIDVYAMPFLGLVFTLLLFWVLTKLLSAEQGKIVTAIFAATAVSCYYWYRLPSLLGFGKYPNDGFLVNLNDSLPLWSISLMTICTSIFFFYWIVFRQPGRNSWVIRPAFAKRRQV